MKKRLPLILVSALLFALLLYSFLPEAVPVELGKARIGELRVTVEEDGKTRVRNRFEISAPLAGRLQRIQLKPGAELAANQVVALLYPTPANLLDARSLEQARARAAAAKAQRDKAQSEKSRAQSASDLAQSECQRIQALIAQKLGTAQELERALAERTQRLAELQAAEQAIQIAEQDLRGAQAALQPASEGRLASPFEVRAPIAGKVFRVIQESEGIVVAGQPLLELADPNDLEILVDLLSKDAVRVPQGANVVIEHWGGENALAGKVRQLEPSGFTKLSALGVEEQRVNAIIELTSPVEQRAGLGDGFRVEAKIEIWHQDKVLMVPESALFWKDNSWHLFRESAGKAEEITVSTGQRNGEYAQILEGVQAGDNLILHPGDNIQTGTKVRGLE